ncbi:MAG: macro domain-containing protein [Bacteroidales bacterium]|nr:macro domain-containing protein [Candidatus Colimorpha merdihippi]
MIEYTIGNIFESDAEALVNTVNTVGVMGKGVALQFKKMYHYNFKSYAEACKRGDVQIGKMFVVRDSNLMSEKTIVNFPTKTDWRLPSEYEYIEKGLEDLVNVIKTYQIKSIAIPPLGAGNGGLQWWKVKQMINDKLAESNARVIIYEPSQQVKEQMSKERVKLTDARALLLYVLFDLIREGEYVSEFSSEKVCYFLQRFGAEKYFHLEYRPYFYGPYSSKVKRVLYALNGSYVMGYSAMDKKAFEPIFLIKDCYSEIVSYIESNKELAGIAEKTMNFLRGYYSDFALELLSSIDYLLQSGLASDRQSVIDGLNSWNDRKRSLFSDTRYIDISLKHLSEAGFINQE